MFKFNIVQTLNSTCISDVVFITKERSGYTLYFVLLLFSAVLNIKMNGNTLYCVPLKCIHFKLLFGFHAVPDILHSKGLQFPWFNCKCLFDAGTSFITWLQGLIHTLNNKNDPEYIMFLDMCFYSLSIEYPFLKFYVKNICLNTVNCAYIF